MKFQDANYWWELWSLSQDPFFFLIWFSKSSLISSLKDIAQKDGHIAELHKDFAHKDRHSIGFGLTLGVLHAEPMLMDPVQWP